MRSVVTATPDIDLRCCSSSNIGNGSGRTKGGAIHLFMGRLRTIWSNSYLGAKHDGEGL
jgi:hypothetical protein